MANSLGLDIGTSHIKAVMLSGSKKSLELKSFLISSTPPKGMLSESSFDQEEMASTIHKTLSDAKISANSAHVALADSQVFTKVVDMPVLSEKELSSAIYWEAEQYIPVPLSTVTIDWKILRKTTATANEPKMQVLLVGAPTVLIKKYVDIFDLAGITITSLETEILSVIRATIIEDKFPTSLVINIGALSTSLAIVQNGVIVFTYSIPLGGTAISRVIAADFGFTVVQAEEYKKTYGISHESMGGKIGHAIESILSAMVTEVKKALSFYNEKYKNESPVSQIILSGGTAKMTGIDVFFVRNIGVETVIANPWKLHSVKNIPKMVMDNASDYVVSVGLALKDYE